jgi:hypothetical protein
LILYVLNSKNLHNETISRKNVYEISRNFAKCTDIWKIYITKQFREIIYTKFREISQNFAKESTTKFRGISRNFAKLKLLSSLFRISRNKKSYFATTLSCTRTYDLLSAWTPLPAVTLGWAPVTFRTASQVSMMQQHLMLNHGPLMRTAVTGWLVFMQTVWHDTAYYSAGEREGGGRTFTKQGLTHRYHKEFSKELVQCSSVLGTDGAAYSVTNIRRPYSKCSLSMC